MASSKLSILKTKLQGNTSWDSVISNILQKDSEDVHCVINEQSNDYIGGYYLIFTIQNQRIFNLEENKFETIPIKKQNVVKFDIFIVSEKMLLWGNKKSADLFITALMQSSNNQLIVDNNKVEFKHMVSNILAITDIKFTRMRITNVVINDGIVANCSVVLSSLDEPRYIIKKYIDCISQLTIMIEKGNSPVSLTLYSSGAVVLSKDRDNIDDETLECINIIAGGEY